MPVESIIRIVFASVAAFLGVYALAFYAVTGERRENLSFCAVCFSVAFVHLYALLMGSAFFPAQAEFWARHTLVAQAATWSMILGLAAGYMGWPIGWPEYTLWACWLGEIAVSVARPVRTLAVPALPPFCAELGGAASPFISHAVRLVAAGYLVACVARYAHQRERERAAPFMAGTVLLGFGELAHILILFGIGRHCLHPYAYQGFILCVAYSLLLRQAHMQAKLRESQAELESIFRASPIGIGIVAERTFVQLNKRMEEMTGWVRDELMGRSARILYPTEEEFERVGRDLERQVAERGTGLVETTWRRKDGTPCDVLLGWAPLHMPSGRRLYSFAAVDISAPKETERTLQENERFLRNIFTSIQDGLSILDTELNIVRVNPTMERWYAHGSPLRGKKCYAVYHGRTEPCEVCPSRRAMEKRQACYNVVPKIGPEGRIVGWLDLYSFPLIDEGTGRVIGVIEYVRDITERRRAEEEVLRLAAAVNAAAESIMITDVEERIVYVNPCFEQLTGYSHEEAIGQRPSLVRSGKHDRAFYKALHDTIRAGNVWRGHFTNRRKDGTLYEEEAVISPVRDESGRIVNFVAVKRDVTHELLLENELRQSQKMEAIGRLAGRVAHDFTNLLVIIQGNAGLAKERATPESGLGEFLDSILDACNRACKLTGQLLAFSQRQPMILRRIDLGRTVATMEDMLRRTLRSSIRLGLYVPDAPCPVRADPDHLEQIMLHLAINAADAMPEQGTLTVETSHVVLSSQEAVQLVRQPREQERRGGAFGVLCVSDSGCGMTPDVKAHLFEPFFTTKGVGKSTGLGLSTVYGIVQQHEGAITVYSAPGFGTSFRLYLRLFGKTEQDAIEAEARLPVPTGSETLLLADEDPMARGLLVGICQSLGYSVFEAENARQLVRLAAEYGTRIALLLVDYILLKECEKDILEEILGRCPKAKIIPTTGFTRQHLIACGALADDAIVMDYPYQRGVVARALRHVLDQSCPSFRPS